MNEIMERHIKNLKRQVGNDGSGRYSFIVSQDDLTNSYLQMRDELGYPLMVDSKRRRAIVYNKKGIEKKLQQLINQSIDKNIKILEDTVAEDIVNNVVNQLNSITQNTNGKMVIKNQNYSSNFSGMFGGAIGKGIVDGLGKIIDDMTDVEKDRRK